MSPLRLCVMASGGGSNLKAIINAVQWGKLNAEIVLVISNNADSGALHIAGEAGVPALHLSAGVYPDADELPICSFGYPARKD